MQKQVKLISLTLQNFKGAKDRVVRFGDVTTISGANATGKSTIFDAFTWVLFGKDSHDRTDSGKGGFQIKTVDASGRPIEKLEHSVSAVLTINGQEITLSRQLKEEWVKRRGSAEVVFSGNTTHYLVDGVEVKAAKYAETVDSIIDAQLFKLITNPAFFPSLDWQKQREILMTIAGGVTLEQVAAGREDFQALLRELSGKDIADFKIAKAYDKKTKKAELDDIPVQIAAIQDATPEPAPADTQWERKKGDAEAELSYIDTQLQDIAEATRRQYENAQGIEKEIGEARLRQSELTQAAREAEQNAAFEANARRREVEAQLRALATEESATRNAAAYKEKAAADRLDRARREVYRLTEAREKKLAEFYAEDGTKYSADTAAGTGITCPLFDIVCTNPEAIARQEEAARKAEEEWNARKRARIDQIRREGRELAAQLEAATAEQEAAQEEKNAAYWDTVNSGKDYADRRKALQAELDRNPEATPKAVDMTGNAEWRTLADKIDALNAQKNHAQETAGEDPRKAEATRRKAELKAVIEECTREIGREEGIAATRERNAAKIAALQAREKELAQQIAEVEQREMLADELQRAQIDEVERRVNSMFQRVRFRMFERQINGGEAPTCIPMVGGVPYSDLNSAGRINAGLDIINTLCAFHETTAPVFIDNAEGVNTLIPCGSQLVKLCVTTEPELTVTPETAPENTLFS